MKFWITPKNAAKILVVAVLGLTFIGIAVQVCKYVFGYDYLLGLILFFDLSIDTSIPTWYSSVTLLICSILLAVISSAKREAKDRFALYWGVLAIIFLFLSVDEVARIHETIGQLIELKFTGKTHGFLYYTWVIYGAAFVLIVAAAYLNFLRHLPAKTMRIFILSALVYVGGALGMEIINARYDDLNGDGNLTYHLMTAFEEFLEMSGVAIFIYALMSYIAAQSLQIKTVSIRIEEKDYVDESTSNLSA